MPPLPPASSSSTSLIKLVEDLAASFLGPHDQPGYEAPILRSITVTGASLTPAPTVTLRLKVTPSLCNRLDNLHGGATATLFDICTTIVLALVRKEGFWMRAGVSRTLNVSYLEGVPLGEEVDVEATILKIGKRLSECSLRLSCVETFYLIYMLTKENSALRRYHEACEGWGLSRHM